MRTYIFICLYLYVPPPQKKKITCHLKRDYFKKKGKDRLPVPAFVNGSGKNRRYFLGGGFKHLLFSPLGK